MRNWILALLLTLPLAGCGDDEANGEQGTEGETTDSAVDTSLPGDPAAGQAIFEANCIACHGRDGRGNGGLGGDFVGEPQRLQQDNAVLLGHIADGINGARIMPAQRDILTEEQRRDVLSYIRQQFGAHE